MKDLNEARLKLNDIDDKMKSLFIERMNIVKDIALYKKDNKLPIFDSKREEEMKNRLSKDMGDLQNYYLELLDIILIESKKYQERVINI